MRFFFFLILCASAFGDSLFVAVGYGGRRISSRDGVVWEYDQRWSDTAADDDNVLFNIAFGAGKFVAVGGGAAQGRIVTTRDGEKWDELPNRKGRVATIAFGNDRFVAAHGSELLTSGDGDSFTPGAKLEWNGSIHPRRSAFGDTEAGRMFVIIGDADLFGESQRVSWRAATGDGTAFTKAEHHTPEARDIAYGAGHFVVVGPAGLIEASHDGQTWKRCQAGATEDLQRIVWTGRRFLISGGKSSWASSDGLTWAPLPSAIPCSLAWAREANVFTESPRTPAHPLAIGFSWGGSLHFTNDLITWKKVALPAGPSLESVAFRP
jgi:hypothetical protein